MKELTLDHLLDWVPPGLTMATSSSAAATAGATAVGSSASSAGSATAVGTPTSSTGSTTGVEATAAGGAVCAVVTVPVDTAEPCLNAADVVVEYCAFRIALAARGVVLIQHETL